MLQHRKVACRIHHPRTRLLAALALAPMLLTPLAVVRGDEVKVFNLSAKDGRFQPETLTVPVGQKFKLLVKNDGTTAEEFESSDLNQERVVTPGAQIVVFLGPLDAGSYRFFGDFHRDTANGQIIAK